MIAAGFGGIEPERGVTAGQHILLEAECGDEEAVNHVLRRHYQLYVLAGGDVELVDLALAFHVLDLPHPLFSDDIDFGRVCGRSALLEKYDRAPDEEGQHDKERNDRPADFEDGGPFNRMGITSGHATILNREHRDRDKDERGHDARDQ